MNVNDHFNEFPIDFFNLEVTDFIQTLGFQNVELANLYLERETSLKTKTILTLSEDGYVGDSLQEHLNLDIANTSVVNCAVGQGKTSSLLRIITRYSENNSNVHFVFAVPFVSLISQYQKDLIDLGITESQIFNYDKLGKGSAEGGLDYLDLNRKFHLVTINTLLGNPGENSPLQSEAKYQYIKNYSQLLETNDKSVVFIYDEIHDGIKNFSHIGEAHLWYFSRSLKKNIVLSATYNVQSIEVIKMLIQLTSNRLQILESERRVCRPQSQLYLHFDNRYSSKDLSSIPRIVIDLINNGKELDILSYSRKLCEKILESNNPLGNALRTRFGEVRKCTSNLGSNQVTTDEDINVNRYNGDFCNVGTNFKSGISIEKDNHAFIIILPPDAGGPYAATNGIFTDGVNAVIQALARQRHSGQIHLFLRSPLWMNGDSFVGMNEEQAMILNSEIERVGRDPSTIRVRNNITIPRVRYIPFSEHKHLVKEKWTAQIMRLLTPYSNNSNLTLPNLENYILTEAEKILTLKQFLGKNIASFVTYCAFTNQFYNARLAGYSIPYSISDDGINDDELEELFDDKLNLLAVEGSWGHLNIKEKYTIMRNLVMQSLSNNITQYQQSVIKFKIINFLVMKYGDDISITVPSMKYLSLLNTSENQSQLFQKLRFFINKVNDSKYLSDNQEFYYFKNYESINLFENDKEELWETIRELKRQNPALNLNLMNFLRASTQENIGKKFYDYIINAGYQTISYRITTTEGRKNYKKIIHAFIGRNL
ncbi:MULTISPECIES: DEAD/DEAH box helicase family protein [unclassified Kaistella]|uniref:DEAD/DEAH box helicase family protein n=1 Tax=unclassified Kaistella TaxID=2762626 RepID=UPI002734D729|nr:MULTISPECIES: DEAD/DEAH box helicase family protein [unclassified Kaistella]MDP2455033.1 DEAD/DEAH box helicase family protein [Kaistella sp. SH11-4b]MDP2457941.1 DEAD/DEAH box helicase family protein [Kaistella sp. SH40-3]MDP2460915.1 DEAD/DEAH box helicase family protein [Kaistella sp. SH19-2b]